MHIPFTIVILPHYGLKVNKERLLFIALMFIQKEREIKMINRVVLMGRLVAEPEIKTTARGVSVTTIRLAVERSFAAQGEKREVDFIDVVAWNDTAEFICKTFHKGAMVAVDGSIRGRYIKPKNGTSRYILEVVAEKTAAAGEPCPSGNSVDTEKASSWNLIEDDESCYEKMPFSDDFPF